MSPSVPPLLTPLHEVRFVPTATARHLGTGTGSPGLLLGGWLDVYTSFRNHFHLSFLGTPGGEGTAVPKLSSVRAWGIVQCHCWDLRKVIHVQAKPQEEKS